ncbi:hypothetical protein CEXT_536101 [Caerostris extrusa]|uniref:Uncharacterized protein n=1 Tax=Caerostris extrusa TaxID=172846 RepID=A0AAV4UC86_CAEEX|nr:hypothetical protein CEXT_536101 [Caerostris extrusa]
MDEKLMFVNAARESNALTLSNGKLTSTLFRSYERNKHIHFVPNIFRQILGYDGMEISYPPPSHLPIKEPGNVIRLTTPLDRHAKEEGGDSKQKGLCDISSLECGQKSAEMLTPPVTYV